MNETAEQAEIFSFLEDRQNHGGALVTRIDTHAASVFLAGDRAYKVKRAIKLPYLDYSTLERRRRACEVELEINKKFAPDLYLTVEHISRKENGALQFGGTEAPVEWLLVMKRFDEKQTLDLVVERGPLSDAFADVLAKEVAAGHARAPEVDFESWLDALPKYVMQSCDAFRRHPALFQAGNVDQLTRQSEKWLQKIEPIVTARARRGLIRRGHGDLHLGNIALVQNKPLLFDAIEFDELVASGDVLYDLAFLLMDLIESGQGRAANIVLNRYLRYSRPAEHFDGLTALPLYLSLRASIRAAVMVAKFERNGTLNEAHKQNVKNYFTCALEFLSPPKPILIAIGGLSGTGKSVLAADIAEFIKPYPGALVFRSDVERKNLVGVGELDRLADNFYGQDWNTRTYEFLMQQAAKTLKAGHSAVIDAVFSDVVERHAAEQVARSAGVEFFGIFLVSDFATRLARITGRMGDASDATAEVALRQEKIDLENIRWARLDAAGTSAETLKRLRHHLLAE